MKLDGNVGIIGNGAGLVMSTLDVVAQAGAKAANFLDVGGGASADQMATSLEVVLSDPAVKAVFINIFGGHHPMRPGGSRACWARSIASRPPCRSWSASTAPTPRRAARSWPRPRTRGSSPAATMLEAAERAAGFANGEAA